MRIQGQAQLQTEAAIDTRRSEAVRVGAAEVAEVDSPDFVAHHIGGVFDAIVDGSIAQMEAYGDLLASVTKSVEDFIRENTDDDDDDD